MSAQTIEYPRVTKVIYNERAKRDEVHAVLLLPPSDVAPRRPPSEELVVRRAPALTLDNARAVRTQQRKAGSDEQRSEAFKLLKAGHSQRSVSKATGISQWTVARIALEAGLGRKKVEETQS